MEHHSAKPHIKGFIYSLILTICAFFIMLGTHLPMTAKIIAILILAILQLFVQLIYFMHLWESKERVFQVINTAFGFFVAATIVFGSIWIMLYNTMIV